MRNKLLRSTLFLSFFSLMMLGNNKAHSQCAVDDVVFSDNESIGYLAYYNWGFLWVEAGEVTFSVNKHSSSQNYILSAIGNSLPKYDWMFRVRDTFVSVVESKGLLPLGFRRRTNEGGYWVKNDYVFNNKSKLIYTKTANSNKETTLDSLTSKGCTYDLVSAVYFARCIDFSKLEIDAKVPITTVVDNEIHDLNVRYLGKETIELRNSKKKEECIKFSVSLVAGTVFKDGENMTVWVRNDKNRVPVMVEAKILIGSVKAILTNESNLKY